MPTPNGIILPFEFVDQQLKERGIKGHVDSSTGLLLVEDNEPAKQFLSKPLQPRHDPATPSGRTNRKDMV
jgi:hypothetical protein